jgi:hypothetical protein
VSKGKRAKRETYVEYLHEMCPARSSCGSETAEWVVVLKHGMGVGGLHGR